MRMRACARATPVTASHGFARPLTAARPAARRRHSRHSMSSSRTVVIVRDQHRIRTLHHFPAPRSRCAVCGHDAQPVDEQVTEVANKDQITVCAAVQSSVKKAVAKHVHWWDEASSPEQPAPFTKAPSSEVANQTRPAIDQLVRSDEVALQPEAVPGLSADFLDSTDTVFIAPSKPPSAPPSAPRPRPRKRDRSAAGLQTSASVHGRRVSTRANPGPAAMSQRDQYVRFGVTDHYALTFGEEHSRQFDGPTLGDGRVFAQTSMRGGVAGRGLYAGVRLRPKSHILYSGEVITSEEAEARKKRAAAATTAAGRQGAAYIIQLEKKGMRVDGKCFADAISTVPDRDGRCHPLPGQDWAWRAGPGSLANQPSTGDGVRANCAIKCMPFHFTQARSQAWIQDYVVLEVLKDIEPGEELLVEYRSATPMAGEEATEMDDEAELLELLELPTDSWYSEWVVENAVCG
jgi:hypothetical protein